MIRRCGRVLAGVVLGLFLVLVVFAISITQPTWGIGEPGRVRADPERLERIVRALAGGVPRSSDRPDGLEAAALALEVELQSSGVEVERQSYEARGAGYRNLVVRFGPAGDHGDPLVVGAHYDAFGDLPGADDNASGAAGLVELARLLKEEPSAIPVELVLYSTEEPPFFGSAEMGSAIHARQIAGSGRAVRGMISLEMIGFYAEQQPWPHWLLGLIYPDSGDFIAVVGRWSDRSLARRVKGALEGRLEAWSYSGPDLGGLDASDHRNYWQEGWPAVMVTDTAFLRNPNYHTARDLPETLDYERMARVVEGLHAGVLQLD